MAKLVVLDAGHGGSDPGAVNGKYHEKNAALAISKKVKARLEELGYTVKMTRKTNDEYLTLKERCEISNKCKADIFVSIHLNAATNPEAVGIETWRYANVGSRTKKLADNVQTELIAATGAKNRGVKTTESLYVLKHTTASACLIECGFISNNKECKKLFTKAYREKLANAIVKGVIKTLSA